MLVIGDRTVEMNIESLPINDSAFYTTRTVASKVDEIFFTDQNVPVKAIVEYIVNGKYYNISSDEAKMDFVSLFHSIKIFLNIYFKFNE